MANITGTNGIDNPLNGTAGDDTINGLGGNDTISGGNGVDTIDGGEGDDTVSGGSGNDLIHGGAGNDTLNGLNDDDTIWGDDGNDTINGGSGNDTLIGGLGNDTLVGGTGIDTAVINADAANNIGTWSGSTLTITTSDGVDRITQTETLQFNDRSFTFSGANVVANLAADTASTDEDVEASGNVLSNDINIDGTLSVTSFNNGGAPVAAGGSITGTYGTLTLNTDGTWNYVPASNQQGVDSFTYTVTDGAVVQTQTLTITINNINDAPVANASTASGDEDFAIIGAVTASDIDNTAGELSYVVFAGPSHGSVVLNTDGTFTYTPNANYFGEDAFTFTATDGSATSAPQSVTLTINAVNDDPVAVDQSSSISEDGDLEGQLSASDVDDNAGALTYVVAAAPLHGQLSIAADGSFTYTPTGDFNGSDSFTWTVTDAEGETSTGTYSITVGAVNDPPVAIDGSASGEEDTDITGVLTATDVDSDPVGLTYGYGSMPANGTLVIDAVTGAYTYTPNANFSGTDSFTFVVYDGQALSETPGTITLTVEALNDSPEGSTSSISVLEDESIEGSVLATDVDNTNAELTYSIGADPEHGTVVFNPDGTYTYTPNADFNGTDSFTWSVEDPEGEGASGTVNITVGAVNDAPRAEDYLLTGTEDNSVLIAIPDTDIDGDVQTVTSVGGQAIAAGETVTLDHGTVTLQLDGDLLFTPVADYNGPVDFSYTLSGPGGDPIPGGVWGDFNAPADFDVPDIFGSNANHSGPHVGGINAYSTEADISAAQFQALLGRDPGFADSSYLASGLKFTVHLNAGQVLNIDQTVDQDSYGDDQQYLFWTGAAEGMSTVGGGDGTFTANVDGTYTFVFARIDFDENNNAGSGYGGYTHIGSVTIDGAPIATSSGETGLHDTGQVHIDISAVNDAPTAAAQSFSGTEDTEITGSVTGGADIDSSELSYELVSGPEGLILNADGSFSYTPEANVNGPVTFTYTVSDGALSSAPAEVTLNFAPTNDAPVSSDSLILMGEDDLYVGTLPTATDIDGTDTLTYALAVGGEAAFGTVIIQPNGAFTYEPADDYNGSDSFSYTVSDGNGGTSTSTISIGIFPVNDAPVAADSSSTGTEDILVTGSVQATDIDSETLTYVLDGANGDDGLILNADGTFTYQAAPDFNGEFSFTYHATDGALNSATVTHTITIDAVNDAPTPTATSASGDEDTTIFGVISTPTDIDGDTTFTFEAGDAPTNGTVTVDPDGSFIYVPNLNYEGPDSFSYTVSDGNGGTATGTVSITVEGVNDAPVGVDASYSVDEDGTLEDTIAATDVDAGDGLTYTLGDDVTSGVLVLNADGSFTYTPDENFNGEDSFTYTVEDIDGETSTGTITLNVGAVNDAPVGEDDSASTFEDSAVTIDVLGNDHDVDFDDELSVTHVNGEALTEDGVEVYDEDVLLGVVTQGEGGLLFTPAANYNGTATFSYTVSDGVLSSTASVSVLIDAQNDAPVSLADAATMEEDTILLGQVPEATDVEGDSYSYSVAETTANGTLEFNPDGSFTYTPNENFHGTDSFTYFATDADDGEPATFTITVESVNDDPDSTASSVTTEEDTPYEGTVMPNVVDPDDNNVFTFSILTEPEHGTVTIDPETGAYIYTPDADYNGPDSFEWSVDDGFEGSSSNQVTITVGPVNDAPAATDYSNTELLEDFDPITITVPHTDVDGDPVSVTAINGQPITPSTSVTLVDGAVTIGVVTLNEDGDIVFAPAQDYNGPVDFEYTLSEPTPVPAVTWGDFNDGGDLNAIQTFGSLFIEGFPDRLHVETTSANVSASQLADIVGRDPGFADTTYNAAGFKFTVTLEAGDLLDVGQYEQSIYTSGNQQFLFFSNGTDEGTIDMSGGPGQFTASVGGTYTFVFAHIDFDQNDSGDYIHISAVTINGAPLATAGAEGNFEGLTSTGSVHLEIAPVNDSPVGGMVNNTTDEDVPVSGFGDIVDIDNDALVYEVSEASNGTVTIDEVTGEYTYTPNENFHGTDSFVVSAVDPDGEGASSTVTITVTPVNDPPVAADITIADPIDEDSGPLSIFVSQTDVDDDSVGVSAINGQYIDSETPVAVIGGVVSLDDVGQLVFTPNEDFNGDVDFEYTLSDGSLSDSGQIHLVVAPVNDAPVGADVTRSEGEDEVVTGFGDFSDVDGDALTYTVGTATNGEVSIDPETGLYAFTPDENYNGQATFTITATDEAGATATSEVTIDLAPVNDAPVATDFTDTIAEDADPIIITVPHTDVDGDVVTVVAVDGQAINAETSVAVTGGSVTLNEDGDLVFTPGENFNGDVDFDYTLADQGSSGTGNFDAGLPAGFNSLNSPATVVSPFGGNGILLNSDATTDQALSDFSDAAFGGWVGGSAFSFNLVWQADTVLSFDLSMTTGLSFFVVLGVENPESVSDGDFFYGLTEANGHISLTGGNFTPIGGPSAPVVGQAYTVTFFAGSRNGVDQGTALVDNLGGAGPLTDDGHVHLTVTPVNDSPEGENSTDSGDEDTVITGYAAATDVDGDVLAYAIASPAVDANGDSAGTVTIDPVTGEYSFTPNANFYGEATFSWSAEDPDGESASGVVTVTVDPVNDAPAVDAGGAYILGEDDTVTGQASGSDLDGDDVEFALVGDGLPGLTFNPDGSWSFNGLANPAAQALNTGQALTLTFSYVATDGALNSAPTTVSLVISGSNELFVLTEGVDTFGGTAGGDEIHALGDDDVISGGAGDDLIFGDGGDDLLGGAVGNDDLRGGAGNDTLSGGAGDDVLDGGEGDDVLNGGAGTDLVSYASATGPVNANMTTGTVTGGDIGVDSLVSIEGITGSSFDDTLIGNALANVLVGGLGNDVLNGMGGDDAMTGGLGNDTFHVDSLGDVVVEADGEGTDTIVASLNYTLAEGSSIEALSASGSAGLTLTGNSAGQTITGGQGSDLLYGLGGNDVLVGGVGNDLLDGGAGADALTGGSGNDIYVVDDAGDTTTEAVNQGTDTVHAYVDATLATNIENLLLMGAAALSGTGNALANTITGNGAANTLKGLDGNDFLYGMDGDDFLLGGLGVDTLDGGAGADTMSGGVGNDTYIADNAGDQLIELAAEGVDTALASVTFVLGANLENLTLTGATAINGTGNEATNIMYGNSAANTLWGMAGGDQIHGGDGNDVIYGGAGNDQMWGDAGADHFMIDNASMILSGARESDTIKDFSVAQGDRIDLSAIDANGNAADGDQAFTFVSAFTRVAGQATLTYSSALDTTQLRLDVNGDGAYDYQLTINGNATTGVPILTGASAPSDGGWLL